jgi:pimeloyl-ACP methyl ester carboxylesterase
VIVRAASLVLAALAVLSPALVLAQTATPQTAMPQTVLPQGRAGYDAYAAAGFNKAFAINREGKWAYFLSTTRSPGEIVAEALKRCDDGARFPCQVVSFNDIDTTQRDPLSIVPTTPEAAPIGALTPSPYYPYRGPRAATGLVVWSHGVAAGSDNTNGPPHGYVNRLRDAGYDIYDFDRRWPDYRRDLATLQDAVQAARDSGYQRVIVAGQSVGAWLSLEAAAKGAPVDAVLAAAPARFGKDIGTKRRENNRDELIPVLEKLRARSVAVTLMFFTGDEYDPGGTSLRARDVLAQGGPARVLLLDAPPGITGHSGGATLKFVLTYGDCIRDFVLRGDRRGPCGG